MRFSRKLGSATKHDYHSTTRLLSTQVNHGDNFISCYSSNDVAHWNGTAPTAYHSLWQYPRSARNLTSLAIQNTFS